MYCNNARVEVKCCFCGSSRAEEAGRMNATICRLVSGCEGSATAAGKASDYWDPTFESSRFDQA